MPFSSPHHINILIAENIRQITSELYKCLLGRITLEMKIYHLSILFIVSS